MLEYIEKSIESKKESYEASGAMVICLVFAALLALAASIVWVAQHWGLIFALLCFSFAFVVLAGIFKVLSETKDQQAGENFEAAERQVSQAATNAATAVSTTVKKAAAVPVRPAVWLPFVVAAGVLYVLYQHGKPDEPIALTGDRLA